jgi:cation diffusion facilitator family transporter
MSKQAHTLSVINKASLLSAITNTILSILKISVGMLGFSYALLTDGIHSLSDVIIDGLVVVSARMGQAAPDTDHPYGHRRIETIGTVVVSLVILAVGLSILIENALRIVQHTASQQPATAVFVVAVISVIANEGLYRYMLKKGKEIRSKLLESSAWHNRSDAITSVVVLVSAGFSWFGWHQVDSIAAILISLFIIKMGSQYTWKSLKELIDTGVDPKLIGQLEKAICETPGVVSLHQLRTRLHAGDILLDGHVQVSPMLSVSEGHYIGVSVYQNIKKIAPHLLDATIHIDVEDDDEDYDEITKIYQPTTRESILNHMKLNESKLPGFSQLKTLTLHYLSKKVSIDLLLPLSLLDSGQYDSLLMQYRACLCELPDIKSVAINFFRD